MSPPEPGAAGRGWAPAQPLRVYVGWAHTSVNRPDRAADGRADDWDRAERWAVLGLGDPCSISPVPFAPNRAQPIPSLAGLHLRSPLEGGSHQRIDQIRGNRIQAGRVCGDPERAHHELAPAK